MKFAVIIDSDALDLCELIPDEIFNHADCCHSINFARWEADVAAPFLTSRGYSVTRWYYLDQDDFDPLVRAVDVERHGRSLTYCYG